MKTNPPKEHYFRIRITRDRSGELCCEIAVDDFVERTTLDLDTWSTSDYERQWVDALSRLVSESTARVIVMTWGAMPDRKTVRRGWRMHRHGSLVRIQERIYVPQDHSFDVDANGAVVDNEDMEVRNDDGDRISEWNIPVKAIRAFMAHDKLFDMPGEC